MPWPPGARSASRRPGVAGAAAAPRFRLHHPSLGRRYLCRNPATLRGGALPLPAYRGGPRHHRPCPQRRRRHPSPQGRWLTALGRAIPPRVGAHAIRPGYYAQLPGRVPPAPPGGAPRGGLPTGLCHPAGRGQRCLLPRLRGSPRALFHPRRYRGRVESLFPLPAWRRPRYPHPPRPRARHPHHRCTGPPVYRRGHRVPRLRVRPVNPAD